MKPHTLIDGSNGLVILAGQFTFEAHRGLKDAFQAMHGQRQIVQGMYRPYRKR